MWALIELAGGVRGVIDTTPRIDEQAAEKPVRGWTTTPKETPPDPLTVPSAAQSPPRSSPSSRPLRRPDGEGLSPPLKPQHLTRTKPALNAFAITFQGRIVPTAN
ncbi:MAG TPA: hypothetical protein VE673_15775 [Pseudonocardiaceae bacterium]|nr:hypothetical protein [Pseudonocardiaceae bacterium]